ARCVASVSLLVTPLRGMDIFECQRFFVQDRCFSLAGVFPHADVRKVRVISQRLTVGCLELLTEMATTLFVAIERLETHQLAELQKVCDASRILERLIQLLTGSEHIHVFPKLFA